MVSLRAERNSTIFTKSLDDKMLCKPCLQDFISKSQNQCMVRVGSTQQIKELSTRVDELKQEARTNLEAGERLNNKVNRNYLRTCCREGNTQKIITNT